MFEIIYKMQMPSGILIFEITLLVEELLEGEACDARELKKALIVWWEDEDAPRRTPEEACLGAWACATNFFTQNKHHPRVLCSRVEVNTSGQNVSFIPNDTTWRKLNA
jgi:hypothetical protein